MLKLAERQLNTQEKLAWLNFEERPIDSENQEISQSEELSLLLEAQTQKLAHHQMYKKLNSIERIKCFMSYHVFAVWDFMSLLKSLQNKISCTSVPWQPSGYSGEMVRLINEIVLTEESDLDQDGQPTSHFDLYLRAMAEVGVDPFDVRFFLETGHNIDLLKPGVREFVKHNLEIAQSGAIEEVAATFFYGREKLIPEMFTSIVEILKREGMQCPTLIYYLERHIEVDGQEHGVLAHKCLDYLCDTEPKRLRALQAGLKALYLREQLWDYALAEMEEI